MKVDSIPGHAEVERGNVDRPAGWEHHDAVAAAGLARRLHGIENAHEESMGVMLKPGTVRDGEIEQRCRAERSMFHGHSRAGLAL